MTYFEDGGKITYPKADQIVVEWISSEGGERRTATSRDVIRWSGVDDTSHNQRRIHDALSQFCAETGKNWAGRTVFQIPDDTQDL